MRGRLFVCLAAHVYLFLCGARRTIICNFLIRHRPLAVAAVWFLFGVLLWSIRLFVSGSRRGFFGRDRSWRNCWGCQSFRWNCCYYRWKNLRMSRCWSQSFRNLASCWSWWLFFSSFWRSCSGKSSQLSLSNSLEAAVWRL